MRIKINIEGKTPLICNKFSDAAALAATEGSRGASAAAERLTPKEACKEKLYLNDKGAPTIPVPNLLRCIVEGGRFHKAGRSQITTKKGSTLFACVEIEGVAIEIKSRENWTVDTRPVRIPATGGRILTHRPMFNDWSLNFEVILDTRILGLKLFRQIVDDAGNRIGLGDFRPDCKGPYGRFSVTRWVESE